jgi:hypothetical protein
VEHSNTPLLPINKSLRQKKIKNFRIKWYYRQNELKDFYRILNPVAAQYTFFSGGHRIVSKIDILGHKARKLKQAPVFY